MKVSVSTKIINERGKENTINFQRKELSIEEFFNLVVSGYVYTTVFNKNEFHIKEKTKANWRSTEFVSFDFDDVDVNVTLSKFIEGLTIKPTMAYCTHHHLKEKKGKGVKARFRLIYVLDKEVINQYEYKSIYQAIADKLGIQDDDKTALEVERFFYGNAESEEIYLNADNILMVESLDLKPYIKPIKEKITKTTKLNNVSKELKQLIEENDFTELFLILTKERGNKVITESNVIYNNKGYADLNDEYIELQRVFENGKPKVYNDGELRHRKLFQWLMIRKQIKPNITFEELLTNAIFDLQHFINNTDGKFSKSLLLNIALSAYNHPITIRKKETKKTFKISKQWCIENETTPNQYKMVVRKIKNDESIGQWYDINKSVKENLNFAKENNIKVSRRTLYNFCERNKTQPTPQQIEGRIKKTYSNYMDFENDYDNIKKQYKSILEKDKLSNNSTRWLELLKYYQSLKITA